jgi:WD40 repeat protein
MEPTRPASTDGASSSNPDANAPDFLTKLPAEIHQLIVQYLKVADFARLAEAGAMLSLFQDRPTWKALFRRDYPGAQSLYAKADSGSEIDWRHVYRCFAAGRLWTVQHRFKGHHTWVVGIACCGGNRFVTVSHDKTIRIWSLDDEVHIEKKTIPNGATCVTQLKDGRIAYGSTDKMVYILPIDGDKPIQLQGHTEPVRRITALPDGGLASVASFDKTLRIWSSNGDLVAVLRGNNYGKCCLAPISNNLIAVGGEAGVGIYSPDGVCEPTLLSEQACTCKRYPSSSKRRYCFRIYLR